MQKVHVDVYSRGVDDMPSGVPTDFSLKYAVFIDLNEEINLENYVEAIANEIALSAILFVNRKKGKLIVYLRSITHVQELVGNNLFINGKQLNINYLGSPKRKVVLGNVDPYIPNSVLLPYLNKYGVVKSKPSYVTAGFGGKLGHIKSSSMRNGL